MPKQKVELFTPGDMTDLAVSKKKSPKNPLKSRQMALAAAFALKDQSRGKGVK